ncbi:hypothetical protein ACFYO2_06025 [Streptomyces sp. NPDC006602]|uniref:hypothetical protein n=1 Tax=Streptomyces sp. NPDC006602 TaxID=3364751 RepID=UPI0036BF65E7
MRVKRPARTHQQSDRQLQEASEVFAWAHELGMFTVLWCYLRNPALKDGVDYSVSADLTEPSTPATTGFATTHLLLTRRRSTGLTQAGRQARRFPPAFTTLRRPASCN